MNQSYQFIKLECADGQATLSLNRPPLNVINLAQMQEIIEALTIIRSDGNTRLLMLRGEGRCFSAGMDVADHLPEKVRDMFGRMHQMMQIIWELDVPTISAIHGQALGGGLELALITDLTYAVSGTRIGQPEINLGVFPPMAVAYFAELIGAKNASDLILSGRTITAEEGVQMGFINGVFDSKAFDDQIQRIAESLLGHSKASIAITKRALRRTGEDLFERLKIAENIYLEELMRTEDATEGLMAFVQKRPPQWRHR